MPVLYSGDGGSIPSGCSMRQSSKALIGCMISYNQNDKKDTRIPAWRCGIDSMRRINQVL